VQLLRRASILPVLLGLGVRSHVLDGFLRFFVVQFLLVMSDTIEVKSWYGLEYAVPNGCAHTCIGPEGHYRGLHWKEAYL